MLDTGLLELVGRIATAAAAFLAAHADEEHLEGCVEFLGGRGIAIEAREAERGAEDAAVRELILVGLGDLISLRAAERQARHGAVIAIGEGTELGVDFRDDRDRRADGKIRAISATFHAEFAVPLILSKEKWGKDVEAAGEFRAVVGMTVHVPNVRHVSFLEVGVDAPADADQAVLVPAGKPQ